MQRAEAMKRQMRVLARSCGVVETRAVFLLSDRDACCYRIERTAATTTLPNEVHTSFNCYASYVTMQNTMLSLCIGRQTLSNACAPHQNKRTRLERRTLREEGAKRNGFTSIAESRLVLFWVGLALIITAHFAACDTLRMRFRGLCCVVLS